MHKKLSEFEFDFDTDKIKSSKIKMSLKLHIYRTCVWSRLVYGSECWTLDSKACVMINDTNNSWCRGSPGKLQTIRQEVNRKTLTFDVTHPLTPIAVGGTHLPHGGREASALGGEIHHAQPQKGRWLADGYPLPPNLTGTNNADEW